MLGSTSNSSAGSSTDPSVFPPGVLTSICRAFWVLVAILILASLDRAADQHQSTGASGNRAFDKQHTVFGIHLVHQQVLSRHPVIAHPAGHPGALEHPARCRAAADRARPPVHGLRAVAGALTAEAVPLHGA